MMRSVSQCRQPRPQCGGMTLVEMTVAMAIVALLALAGLAVATNLSRGRRLDERKTAAATIVENVEAILATDIRNATKYRTRAGAVELLTRASLDTDTLELRHLPVTVVYEVREIAGTKWLVRRQRDGGKDVLTELVCRNVAGLTLKAVGAGSKRSSRTWRQVPASVEAVVEFEDSSRPALRVWFRIR